MDKLIALLTLSCSVCLGTANRRLQQANGPGIVGRPVSATSADLVNDPTGRAHLLVHSVPLTYASDDRRKSTTSFSVKRGLYLGSQVVLSGQLQRPLTVIAQLGHSGAECSDADIGLMCRPLLEILRRTLETFRMSSLLGHTTSILHWTRLPLTPRVSCVTAWEMLGAAFLLHIIVLHRCSHVVHSNGHRLRTSAHGCD